ncbi:MAG: glycosyltransferase [Candidatus Krumholzibacteriota bacterium]|nr:glycosyltransferase [Candidatus Krumholzibacteriota bacterium]
MDVSIIVVTHNSVEPVARCLDSLARHAPACAHETIVIDNASRDGTPEMIRDRFPGVRLAANRENVGYARGVNQGIRMSTGRAILVLNPDIELRDDAVGHLLASLDARPRAGIVASRLVYPNGRLQHSCRAFYTAKAIILRRTFLGRLFPRAKALRAHLMTDWDHETPRQVDWVIGACMMARREAIEQVGMMDERFFLYFEDIDWCYRMQHLGWEVWYEPASTMVHSYERSSASMLRKPFLLHVLSLLRYVEKWNRLSWFFRRHRETLKTAVFVCADLVAINAAFFAAYYLRLALQARFVYGLYPLDWYRVFILFSSLVFVGTFAFSGLYRVQRGTHWTEESIRVARAVFLVFTILLAATYLGRIRIYSRAVLLSQAVFSIILVAFFRRIVRIVHRQLVRTSFDLKRVLLVGSAKEAAAARRLFTADRDTGIDVVGAVTGEEGSLCAIGDLSAAIELHKIQEIVVLPSRHERELLVSVLLHRGKSVPVRIASPLAGLIGQTARVDEIGGLSLFSVGGGGGGAMRRLSARCLDVAAAAILLVVSCAAWTAAAIAGRAPRRRRETRFGSNKRAIRWPRALRADGRDASDLLNPTLFVYLLTGRLALAGPPAVFDTRDLPPDPPAARPGIAGRWRYAGAPDARTAIEDELLAMRNRRFTGDLVTIARSLRVMAAGRYPDWFTQEVER